MDLASFEALVAAAPFILAAGMLARAAFAARRPLMNRRFDFDGRKRRERG